MLKLLCNTTMFGFIVLITLDTIFEKNFNRNDSIPKNCILPETNKRIMYEIHARRKT